MPHFREKSNGDGRRPSPFSASAQRTGVRALRAILSRRSRGLAPFCGQRPHFSPSQGEVLPAPHSLFARKENGPLERSKRERARGIDAHCPTRSAKGPLDPNQLGEGGAFTQPKPPSKKKGFTGEHGSIPRRAVRGGDPNGMDSGRSIPGAPAVLRGTGRAGKSRAARGAVPHCISAEMPRLWWGRPSPASAACEKSPSPPAAGILPSPRRARNRPPRGWGAHSRPFTSAP